VEDWNWETMFIYGYYKYIFNHCDVLAKQSNSEENAKRAITPFRSFKVIEVGINRKPVCDFLLIVGYN